MVPTDTTTNGTSPTVGENLERYSFGDWMNSFSFASNAYVAGGPGQSYTSWGSGESITHSFEAFVRSAYQASPVVFACVQTRALVFAEAVFKFRAQVKGRPGNLYGTPALRILEKPWPGGTTGELLARMEQDASLAGNSYWVAQGDRLVRLRPDWVMIVVGSDDDVLDGEVLGYAYWPGGRREAQPQLFTADEVAHYSPVPDPLASYRGMSWLTPVLREIQADSAATLHKEKFFTNGATPNLLLKSAGNLTQPQVDRLLEVVNSRHGGAQNAYKTMILGGGIDATVIGADFKQMDFRATQGAGETRIAAAAGVPPVIVGLSEGLSNATYSNYSQARRRFADGTLRPLWRMAAAALENVVDMPDGAQLWYDESDVAFLREDESDTATIQSVEAATIKSLVDAGFAADVVVAAVTAGDLRQLAGAHSGLFSVQLQPPGSAASELPAVG